MPDLKFLANHRQHRFSIHLHRVTTNINFGRWLSEWKIAGRKRTGKSSTKIAPAKINKTAL